MINVDKVIVLENNEKYLVLDKIVENDIEYYYIAKINISETDIENNFKLAIINEIDGDRVLVEVTGQNKLKEILPKFANII